MKPGNKKVKPKRLVSESAASVDAPLTEAILNSISDGVFTVDHQWRITSFNRAAERITGVSCQEALGRSCAEVFRSSLCGAQCALRETMTNGERIVGRAAYIITATGARIPRGSLLSCQCRADRVATVASSARRHSVAGGLLDRAL